MYFDLNVPISASASSKGKAKQGSLPIAQIDAKIELLVHLGYTVIALCQSVNKRVEKGHVNILDEILPKLKKREGILYLKRLNIILDEDSEKGFGLINAYLPTYNRYDIISLTPTTQTTFSQACLTHSQPSQLTAHVISLPLTLPRLPYHLKHTLVRTAIRNGAVFEINYVGSLGGENDPVLEQGGAGLSGANAKRNWWASARELCRVTKGKGVIVSGGVANDVHFRAPRDVGNIITLLGLPQNLAHDAMAVLPKSVTLRAQTRLTYRAVLSEPEVVIPPGYTIPQQTKEVSAEHEKKGPKTQAGHGDAGKKRRREDSDAEQQEQSSGQVSGGQQQTENRKKKKQKNKNNAGGSKPT